MASYWAFTHRIPVAHVEAGLRTYDLGSPFPEEANRQIISRIASLHFAPTVAARRALERERVERGAIYEVGNTAIDALHYAIERESSIDVPESERLDPKIRDFVGDSRLVLVTAHRRESFGAPFEAMCRGIRAVADDHPDVKIVYPVHPNPNVRTTVLRALGDHPRIRLCDPLPYVAFISLMKRSDLLLTDSGGVQEEAPTLRKPILVMRETTERPEGVEAGFARLVGTDPDLIRTASAHALRHGLTTDASNPYGDGRASERIVSALESALGVEAPEELALVSA